MDLSLDTSRVNLSSNVKRSELFNLKECTLFTHHITFLFKHFRWYEKRLCIADWQFVIEPLVFIHEIPRVKLKHNSSKAEVLVIRFKVVNYCDHLCNLCCLEFRLKLYTCEICAYAFLRVSLICQEMQFHSIRKWFTCPLLCEN